MSVISQSCPRKEEHSTWGGKPLIYKYYFIKYLKLQVNIVPDGFFHNAFFPILNRQLLKAFSWDFNKINYC